MTTLEALVRLSQQNNFRDVLSIVRKDEQVNIFDVVFIDEDPTNGYHQYTLGQNTTSYKFIHNDFSKPEFLRSLHKFVNNYQHN